MDGAPLGRTPEREIRIDADDETAALTGAILEGRYRLEVPIGIGGMGVVYRATHVAIGKSVAVKVLRRRFAADPDLTQRFLTEARVASSIRHDHVVEITDFGHAAGRQAFLVMELLQGRSLAEAIDEDGRLPPLRALGIAMEIAAGLGAAHDAGIVHRDLKPSNVFLCDRGHESSRVKIFDFGVARVLGRKTRLTAVDTVIGTPEYMSPEQAQGSELDGRSDLYALGVILFEMLVGRVPFVGRSVIDTLTRHAREAPPRLLECGISREVSGAIEPLLLSLLAKHPDRRPASARVVHATLARLVRGPEDLPRGNGKTIALGSNCFEPHSSVASVGGGRGHHVPSHGMQDWLPPAGAAAVIPTVRVDSVAATTRENVGIGAPPRPVPGESFAVDARTTAPAEDAESSQLTVPRTHAWSSLPVRAMVVAGTLATLAAVGWVNPATIPPSMEAGASLPVDTPAQEFATSGVFTAPWVVVPHMRPIAAPTDAEKANPLGIPTIRHRGWPALDAVPQGETKPKRGSPGRTRSHPVSSRSGTRRDEIERPHEATEDRTATRVEPVRTPSHSVDLKDPFTRN